MDKCPNYETQYIGVWYRQKQRTNKLNNFGVTVLLLAHSRKFILLCDVQGILLSYIMPCRRKVVIEKKNSSNTASN